MGVDLEQMNICLAGCGYLGIYHVGVASCMKKFAPRILKNKITGASVGALVAASFACEVPIEESSRSMFNVSMQVRNGILGPITPDLPIMKILYDGMAALLPNDAHLYCNGRLHISCTRYDNCENVLLNQFDSKEDLLQALMCSCFIPLYCGYPPPEFHGVAYVDGGYSDNSPKLDAHTVTVAPFSGESEICPKDIKGDLRNFTMNNTSIYMTLKNCRRLLRILFPGPPDMLKDLWRKGFNDGLLFLRDNGIIPCPDCSIEINANHVTIKNMDHAKCRPLDHPMPIEISNVIDECVQRLNDSFAYRILQNPVVKILYYLNVPGIFTFKVSQALLTLVARKLHDKASSCVDNILKDLPQILREILQHPKLQRKDSRYVETGHFYDESSEESKSDSESSSNDNYLSSSESPTEYLSSDEADIKPANDLFYKEQLLNMTMHKRESKKAYQYPPKFQVPPDSTIAVAIGDTMLNIEDFLSKQYPLPEEAQKILAETISSVKEHVNGL